MKKFLVQCTKATLLVLLVTMCHAEEEFQPHRRGGTNMGLFPFPRVGRSDPSLAAYNEFHEAKRQGLIPFPRVGRSDPGRWLLPDLLVDLQKRNGGSNNVNGGGGMWFGPRLGRLQKRSFEDYPWALVAVKDASALKQDYTPRIGRESEEEDDDAVVEEVLSAQRLDSKNRNNISQQ